MDKVSIARRKFLVATSAATGGVALAACSVDLSASPSAKDILRVEEWKPDGRYEPGSLVRTLHGDVLIGDFEEVLAIPGRYLNDHCLVKDGSYWMFFKHGWWTQVVQSSSPFDFLGSPPIPLGYSHASKVFFWQENWWITHCKTFPDDFSQQRSNRLKGLYMGRLEWPKGGYPRFAQRLSSSN